MTEPGSERASPGPQAAPVAPRDRGGFGLWSLQAGPALPVLGAGLLLVAALILLALRPDPARLVGALAAALLGLAMWQRERQLSASARVRAGMGRLGDGALETRIAPVSREATPLETAFDAMADQVAARFGSLSEHAEAVHEILSTLDTGQIVRTALQRLPQAWPCSSAQLIVRRRGQREAERHLRVCSEGAIQTCRMDADALRSLRRMFRGVTDALVVPPGDPRIELLRHPRQDARAGLVAFPLFFKRDLLGVICLAPWTTSGASASLPTSLRQLADHVAVALSNARMLDEIQFFAYYDELTGLPNRVLCTERISQALGRARRSGGMVAVLLIDLDSFKRVNDSLGEDVGDDLIRAVSQRLAECVRAEDTLSRPGTATEPDLARIGGDEFAAVIENLSDGHNAASVCKRIFKGFEQPFQSDGREVFLSVSLGVAVFPHDGDDADALLRNAYTAMCHVKQEGRNDFHFYREFMNDEAEERLTIENRLRKAIELRELRLEYQPLVDAETRTIRGVEVLSRWTDAELGEISPVQFIPIAEETGLIVPLGRWILESALGQVRAWSEQGLPGISISVNVSSRQFRDRDFVQTVRELIEQYGVEPGRVTLEITESLLMRRTDEAIGILQQLRDLGLKLSIDDFGTGYSSLSYLKHLPVNHLKIDRSFVHGLGARKEDEAIVSAIVALGHILGLGVIAEGVEVPEQFEYLLAQGCDVIQGFLFSRPLAPEALAERLRGGPYDPPG